MFSEFIADSKTESAVREPKRSGGSLPCLNKNNSIESLPSNVKKQVFALTLNTEYFIDTFGINSVGFLTLTFKEPIDKPKEANRRFNSFSSNFLRKHTVSWIKVQERHLSGRIHFHLLIAVDSDIRSGFDFDAVRKRNYSSVPAELKRLWKLFRENCPKYGFGRHQLEPVRSTAEGMAKYLSKYLTKDMGKRYPNDKGARLVSYGKYSRIASSRFSWVSDGARLFRMKLALFVHSVANDLGVEPSFESMKSALGDKWMRNHRHQIIGIDLAGADS
ncbi:rolling circle replication-associated protein [Idiomarina sp. UBA3162]|uniref:rolling circle replication-associated protein n=1 Tax=Idiomarina sp. UBA3162 TaxID=1946641 RepID=UPI000C976FDB|nr:hypothetical protein [Idiomarina sp. UBA3162]MAD54016.1 phasyl DNA replicon protein arp [Idiomarinaceae bacterium]